MAAYRSTIQSRRDRKLPTIGKQNSPTSSFFWLSFQSALQWVRKNEKTISRFSQLLQLYPNLIQDSSLDGFWEFLAPLLEQQNEVKIPMEMARYRSGFHPPNSLPVPSKDSSERDLPTISVTPTSESPVIKPFIPFKKARTPRVHLIMHHDNSTLAEMAGNISEKGISKKTNISHQDILDLLQEHFFVRRAYPPVRNNGENSTGNDISQLYVLSESDACVFVFNNATVDNAGCFHDLCTALGLKIPVVFIRHHNQELPKNFAESIQRVSRGCACLNDYVDAFVFGNHELRGSVDGKRKQKRPNNNVAAYADTRTRSSSASDINVRGVKLRKGRKKPPNLSVFDTDLLLYLINSFQTAYIFDENDILGSSRQVRLSIYRAIGITNAEVLAGRSVDEQRCSSSSTTDQENAAINSRIESQGAFERKEDARGIRSNRLNVPEADNMLLAREWSTSGCVSAPPRDNPGRDGRFTYHFRSVTPAALEQKSTTYLVFDDRNASKKIRKISFPLDESDVTENCSDMDSDEYDPGGSPIHFPDIDLAREINATFDNPEFE